MNNTLKKKLLIFTFFNYLASMENIGNIKYYKANYYKADFIDKKFSTLPDTARHNIKNIIRGLNINYAIPLLNYFENVEKKYISRYRLPYEIIFKIVEFLPRNRSPYICRIQETVLPRIELCIQGQPFANIAIAYPLQFDSCSNFDQLEKWTQNSSGQENFNIRQDCTINELNRSTISFYRYNKFAGGSNSFFTSPFIDRTLTSTYWLKLDSKYEKSFLIINNKDTKEVTLPFCIISLHFTRPLSPNKNQVLIECIDEEVYKSEYDTSKFHDRNKPYPTKHLAFLFTFDDTIFNNTTIPEDITESYILDNTILQFPLKKYQKKKDGYYKSYFIGQIQQYTILGTFNNCIYIERVCRTYQGDDTPKDIHIFKIEESNNNSTLDQNHLQDVYTLNVVDQNTKQNKPEEVSNNESASKQLDNEFILQSTNQNASEPLDADNSETSDNKEVPTIQSASQQLDNQATDRSNNQSAIQVPAPSAIQSTSEKLDADNSKTSDDKETLDSDNSETSNDEVTDPSNNQSASEKSDYKDTTAIQSASKQLDNSEASNDEETLDLDNSETSNDEVTDPSNNQNTSETSDNSKTSDNKVIAPWYLRVLGWLVSIMKNIKKILSFC